MSLIARHLEANGIVTVIMGCARDIVENAAVPRFFWSDFPLGNSAGKPHDIDSQTRTLADALTMVNTARAPQTTVASGQSWSASSDWQQDFLNIRRLSDAEISRLRDDFHRQKQIANTIKQN